jgi:hypothetical protein
MVGDHGGCQSSPCERPSTLVESLTQFDGPEGGCLARFPKSTSFPSGHAASAATFPVAASLELPAIALPLSALAASVGYSPRVYTGVHYPGDVIVGVSPVRASHLGARLAPARTPRRIRPPEPAIEQQEPRSQGAGIVAVVNPLSGGGRGARAAEAFALRTARGRHRRLEPGTALEEVVRNAAARGMISPSSAVTAQSTRPHTSPYRWIRPCLSYRRDVQSLRR